VYRREVYSYPRYFYITSANGLVVEAFRVWNRKCRPLSGFAVVILFSRETASDGIDVLH
jgi:hypothetical protein